MPNFGSTKQNTGGKKISDGTSGNYDQGSLDGFRSNSGAARKASLRNDNGMGGGRFIDTNNVKSGGDTRTVRGARNKRSLVNDAGNEGGSFIDTEASSPGDGFGGAPKPLR